MVYALSMRLISLLEIVLGSFVVIGHNVFRIVPNEVFILFVLFWLSNWLRPGREDLKQLQRPKSWPRTILLALAAAVILQAGSDLVVDPLAHYFWRKPEHVSSLFTGQAHNSKLALRNLAIVWVFAGFGEEIGYRGYLLPRAADLGNRTQTAYLAAMLYVALLFGFGHFYKGPAGVADSAYSGLILGGVYLMSGRNLWAPILAHGLSDTFAVVILFLLGWAT